MNILLTLPFDRSYRRASPDLGLGYLAAVMRQQGHRVELLLGLHRFRQPEAFEEHIHRGSYDLIGIKTFSCQVKATRETIALIRRAAPHIPIIVGGPHARL